jgi:hypothetical protein
MKTLALSSSDTDLIHISSGYVLGTWSDLRSRSVTERRLSKTFSLIRGPIEFNPILAPPRSVTRGLDPRVHLLCIKVLAKKMDCRVKPGNDGGNRATSVPHPFDRDLL